MVTPERRPRLRRALLPLLTALAGCAVDTPQQYLVPDLRILAIRATVLPSPPGRAADVKPGEPFRLEALVANPGGGPATVDWYACLPAEASPSLPPCLDPERLRDPDAFPSTPGVLALGSGASLDIDLAATQPTLVALLDGAVTAMVGLASTVPTLQCKLSPELPLVAIARSGGSTQVALKRLRINPEAALALPQYSALAVGYELNLNPVIPALALGPTNVDDCLGGDDLPDGALLPPGQVRLCGRTPADLQDFPQCQANGTVDPTVAEELEWQWYVDAGEIAQAMFDGNATRRTIELTPPPGATFTLWAILRDGRGGTDWVVRTLTAP
jgi:hypothetical protein